MINLEYTVNTRISAGGLYFTCLQTT